MWRHILKENRRGVFVLFFGCGTNLFTNMVEFEKFIGLDLLYTGTVVFYEDKGESQDKGYEKYICCEYYALMYVFPTRSEWEKSTAKTKHETERRKSYRKQRTEDTKIRLYFACFTCLCSEDVIDSLSNKFKPTLEDLKQSQDELGII